MARVPCQNKKLPLSPSVIPCGLPHARRQNLLLVILSEAKDLELLDFRCFGHEKQLRGLSMTV